MGPEGVRAVAADVAKKLGIAREGRAIAEDNHPTRTALAAKAGIQGRRTSLALGPRFRGDGG